MMTVDDVSTADLYDELGDTVDSCSVQFVQYGAKTRFSGEIRTIRCFRDNALVKETLNSPGNGRVLVVDGGASLESALLGDLIGEAALKNGWSGVIINGAVRDSQALATLDIGIKALGTNPRKSAKEGAGERDVAVTFGNATFHPGDHVWSDEDGILVTARASAADPSP